MFVSLFIICVFLCVTSSLAAVCDPLNCPLAYDNLPTLKSNATYKFAVGYIASVNVDPSYLSMARWKFYQINNNASILPDTRLDLYLRGDGTGASRYSTTTYDIHSVVGAVATLIQLKSVRALIIDLPEAATQLVGDVATTYGVSVLSISSSTNLFDSKAEFNNLLARLNVPDNNQCFALLQLCQQFNITAVTYVFSQNVYLLTRTNCVAAGVAVNITVTSVATNGKDSAAIAQQYIVPAKVIFIGTEVAEGTPLVTAIQKLGAYGPEYFYIFSLGMGLAVAPYHNNPMTDGAIILIFTIYAPTNPYWAVNNAAWNQANSTLFPGLRPALFGYATMDAANMYANSLDYFARQGVTAKNVTGLMLHNQTVTTPQESAPGVFSFDANADRPGSFALFNINLQQNLSQANALSAIVGWYDCSLQYLALVTTNFAYANGSAVNPFFVPRFYEKCSFEICNYRGNCSSAATCVCYPEYSGKYCEHKERNKLSRSLLSEIIVPVVVVLAIIVLLAFIFVQRRRREITKEVKDKQRSDIPRGDIKLSDRIGRGAAGEVMKGMFRGTDVAVKRLLTKNASKSTIDEFSLEVAIMCGLRHPNIIMFMGSCYDPITNEMLLVMELMSRGSLYDVLHNAKVELPFDMQLHLALQAAQGMNFLHSSNPPIIHCDLKSHNILLDDKWTARISDFGITRFKEASKGKKDSGNSSSSFGTIFWTAPEVLDGQGHSEKSDCYAYGIVLWELFHRKTPYDGLDVMKVAMEVGKGRRPDISDSCPQEMQRLIRACWQQDPRQRPSMQEVVEDLRQHSLMNPLQDLGHHSVGRVQAPVGQVYLIKTMLCHGLDMLDKVPRAATKTVFMHNHHLRTTIESYGGYEVMAHGPNFLISFPNLKSALDWSICVQISLLHLAWPPEIYDLPQTTQQRASSGELLWSGPRVRIAIHAGPAELDKCALGRVTYKGPVVERAQKILGESLEPGIYISSGVYDELIEKRPQLAELIVTPCERVQKDDSTSYYVLPQKLAKRRASGMDTPVLSLNSLDDCVQETLTFDDPTLGSPDGNPTHYCAPSWFVFWKDLTIMEGLGRGVIGDFHRAIHKGKEVAVKVLVNQKLKEDDKITLLADCSILSKINHPNLLPVIGACLDEHRINPPLSPNHPPLPLSLVFSIFFDLIQDISIVSEYISRGNLRDILSDSSTSLSMVQSLKIARDIAAGMGHLTSLPDLEVRIHDNFKSHNVMIGKNWEVKVTDFGQSNIKDLARTMTSVSNVAWTAPEVLEGEDMVPESALYSYGMILWEILTRKVPYENEHPIKVVTKILAGHRPVIPRERIPLQCTMILEGCWNRQIDHRPSWHVIQSELSVVIENLKS